MLNKGSQPKDLPFARKGSILMHVFKHIVSYHTQHVLALPTVIGHTDQL